MRNCCKYNFCEELVNWLCEREECFRGWTKANEHEWDALICAWSAYQGLTGKWTTDLMPSSGEALFPAGPATYFWPVDLPNINSWVHSLLPYSFSGSHPTSRLVSN
jgi:hypothetical protein